MGGHLIATKALRNVSIVALMIATLGCPGPLMDDGDIAGIFQGTVSGPGGAPVEAATVKIGLFDISVAEECSEAAIRERAHVRTLTDEDGSFRERVRTYAGSTSVCVGILVIPPEESGLADGYVELPEVRLVHDEDDLPEFRVDVRLAPAEE